MNTKTNHSNLTSFRNKPAYYLYDTRYMMAFSVGGDTWRIHGIRDSKSLMPGFPISTDKENDSFETTNSIYKIQNYDCDKTKFWDQVESDMKNGGFEIH
jgi:hypothetical protein